MKQQVKLEQFVWGSAGLCKTGNQDYVLRSKKVQTVKANYFIFFLFSSLLWLFSVHQQHIQWYLHLPEMRVHHYGLHRSFFDKTNKFAHESNNMFGFWKFARKYKGKKVKMKKQKVLS